MSDKIIHAEYESLNKISKTEYFQRALKSINISMILLGIFVVGILATPVMAGGVRVQMDRKEVYVNEPAVLTILVESSKTHKAIKIPAIKGVDIAPGQRQVINYSQTINGVHRKGRRYLYQFALTPSKPGRYEIPPFTITVDGKEYKTKPQLFLAVSDTQGAPVMLRVTGLPERAYVGQRLPVSIEILIRPFVDRNLRARISARGMWQQVELNQSTLGDTRLREIPAFHRPAGEEEVHKGTDGEERSYYVYRVNHTLQLEKSGYVNAKQLRFIIKYPTRLARDWFSGAAMPSHYRRITQTIQIPKITVLPLPDKGRPAVFNGAVGHYAISASTDVKTVHVGDPISVTLAVSGTGDLKTLQPPLLHQAKQLNRDFKVPEDKLPGVVTGDSTGQKAAKYFTLILRPRHEKIKAIPPIPFSYFNPKTAKYETVYSEAIPITVKPIQSISMDEIVSNNKLGDDSAEAQSKSKFRIELQANYVGDGLLRQASEPRSWLVPAMGFWGTPMLIILGCMSMARRQRSKNSPRRRIRQAHKQAEQQLRQSPTADSVAATLCQYLAVRLNRPPGSMTAAEVLAALRGVEVDDALTRRLESLLGQCEQLMFSGQAAAVSESLGNDARTLLRELEQLPWPTIIQTMREGVQQ